MTAAARRLLDDALALPDADRAEMAGALADSVPVPDMPGDDLPPAEHRAAWSAELNRRAAEIDSGAVEMIPREEAERRIFGGRDAA